MIQNNNNWQGIKYTRSTQNMSKTAKPAGVVANKVEKKVNKAVTNIKEAPGILFVTFE